jgi:hypothetical protein
VEFGVLLVEVIASNLITRNVSAQLKITKKLIGEHAVAGAFCCWAFICIRLASLLLFFEQLPASDNPRNPAGDAPDSTAHDRYSKPTYSSTLQNREEAPSSYTSNNCLNPRGNASCLLLVTIKLYGVCYILHIPAARPWQ